LVCNFFKCYGCEMEEFKILNVKNQYEQFYFNFFIIQRNPY
jgi:hypothetical protein